MADKCKCGRRKPKSEPVCGHDLCLISKVAVFSLRKDPIEDCGGANDDRTCPCKVCEEGRLQHTLGKAAWVNMICDAIEGQQGPVIW